MLVFVRLWLIAPPNEVVKVYVEVVGKSGNER
jgi:hypothetical protein